MYTLDINFLKYRSNYQKNSKKKRAEISLRSGDVRPLYIGVAVSIFFPALMGTIWWFLQAKNSEIQQNRAELEQENQRLKTEIGNIDKIKEETNKIKQETQALVSVFDQIRPWSAVLQDLRDRIPETVQIDSIKQIPPTAPTEGQPAPNPAGGVEISGFARSFSDVNDFILSLQQSRFFKPAQTKIITVELVDAPIQPGSQSATNIQIKPLQIVKYTIQSSLSNVPASELIPELEQKGAVGLVNRIRSMQQIGVIQK
ncbi:PilN domain-containing protein [Scytonema sp. PCC 10023]|uniref:PilN domain-containing protein n=1 Tax=Scytonema sp. PCC 10023 TaxID=1680591 RepID=UPI0039C6CD5E